MVHNDLLLAVLMGSCNRLTSEGGSVWNWRTVESLGDTVPLDKRQKMERGQKERFSGGREYPDMAW